VNIVFQAAFSISPVHLTNLPSTTVSIKCIYSIIDQLCQDARRLLLLTPYKSMDDLTSDKEELKLLKSVYTDIEQVDFLVGCLVDKDRPDGFAFGIVPYYIFVVMASRRLLSDRFFQEGLTEENYSEIGVRYLMETNFHDILARQFPNMKNTIPRNPFSNDWEFELF
jgi:hypothetical protein